MPRACPGTPYRTANELALVLGIDGRLVSCLLHPVAPAVSTALGRPAWALADALPALRPDLLPQLRVLRCRLVGPGGGGIAGPRSPRLSAGGDSATLA